MLKKHASQSVIHFVKAILQEHRNHKWREEGVTEVAFVDNPVCDSHKAATLPGKQGQQRMPTAILGPSDLMPWLPKVLLANDWALWGY